jgi:hypothetical protein
MLRLKGLRREMYDIPHKLVKSAQSKVIRTNSYLVWTNPYLILGSRSSLY